MWSLVSGKSLMTILSARKGLILASSAFGRDGKDVSLKTY
jgi:hypothetical protein